MVVVVECFNGDELMGGWLVDDGYALCMGEWFFGIPLFPFLMLKSRIDRPTTLSLFCLSHLLNFPAATIKKALSCPFIFSTHRALPQILVASRLLRLLWTHLRLLVKVAVNSINRGPTIVDVVDGQRMGGQKLAMIWMP